MLGATQRGFPLRSCSQMSGCRVTPRWGQGAQLGPGGRPGRSPPPPLWRPHARLP